MLLLSNQQGKNDLLIVLSFCFLNIFLLSFNFFHPFLTDKEVSVPLLNVF